MPNTGHKYTPSLKTHSDKARGERKNFCGKREVSLSQRNMI